MLLGKEIYLFFGSYGIYGFLGIALSGLITTLVVYQVFHLIFKSNVNSYQDFLKSIIRKENIGKSKTLNKRIILHTMINLFLLVSFIIMIAGFGAYFKQEFGISTLFGCIIIAVASYVTLTHNVEGVVKANTLLIPALVLLVFWFGIQNIPFLRQVNFSTLLVCHNTGNWILDSVLYAGYNSILLIPILVSLKKHISSKKDINLSCLLIFVILSLLACIILTLLYRINVPIQSIDIPMLYVAQSIGILAKYIYGFVILAAIFTSAISAGYGFLENFQSSKNYSFITLLICIVGVLVSRIGFSDLVSTLYPVFGYLGILQIFMILLKKKAKTDINEITKD